MKQKAWPLRANEDGARADVNNPSNNRLRDSKLLTATVEAERVPDSPTAGPGIHRTSYALAQVAPRRATGLVRRSQALDVGGRRGRHRRQGLPVPRGAPARRAVRLLPLAGRARVGLLGSGPYFIFEQKTAYELPK